METEIYAGSALSTPGNKSRKTTHACAKEGCGHRHTTAVSEGDLTLDEIFKTRVLETAEWAWYVDHYTEDPRKFNVQFLTDSPVVKWTNEKLSERYPDDPSSVWGSDDVAGWFTDEKKSVSYRHVVKFRAGGEQHVLSLEARKVTLDGQDRWHEYVEFGVRGALQPLLATFEHLDSIEVQK